MEEKRTEARAYTRAEGEDAPGDPRQGLAGVGRYLRFAGGEGGAPRALALPG